MEPESSRKCSFTDALKIPDVRHFIAAVGFFTLASRALAVVIGFQVYQITRSPMAIGWLGLIEAIPAISLVLFGGYVADHFDRKKILLMTRAASVLCALGLIFISLKPGVHSLWGLYAMVFLAGVARAFADPASTAMEAQIVPKHLTVNGASWISGTWITCLILGPAIIGFIFDAWGIITAYGVITSCFTLSWFCTVFLKPTPQIIPQNPEPLFKSIGIGWKFVFRNQPLLAAMSLDLFAVLFGGAIALLPIYAQDILHVGTKGLGLLNAAPSLGALLITLTATRHPPIRHAGRNLLFNVFGFGICFIVFAFSKNFWLSMAMLFLSGIFDGVSMIIRRSMIRLLSPDHLRGRIAAANWVFIVSSNELGTFESGMVAAWIGAVPCVAVGGVLTLFIVAFASVMAPELRKLKFNLQTLEREPS